MFRLIKYSSILYFLGKHRGKLYRSAAILLFAFVTSLMYEDLRVYLADQHPGTLIYALLAKVLIVYGALAFVLLQFRPRKDKEKANGEARAAAMTGKSPKAQDQLAARDRLDALADLDDHATLKSRYDRILAREQSAQPRGSSSTKSSRP